MIFFANSRASFLSFPLLRLFYGYVRDGDIFPYFERNWKVTSYPVSRIAMQKNKFFPRENLYRLYFEKLKKILSLSLCVFINFLIRYMKHLLRRNVVAIT